MTAEPSLDAAIDLLAAGRLVGVPTETEWGLAADARNPDAIGRLFAWKGRDAKQPVSVFVDGVSDAVSLGADFDEEAHALADAFWPGPLTLVVTGIQRLAPGVANADGGLGLRHSAHAVASALARAARARGIGPLTATSLNRSGTPGARDRAMAERAVADGVPALAPHLVAGECEGQIASSVVDCSGRPPRLLREGALSRSQLEAVLSAPIDLPEPARSA